MMSVLGRRAATDRDAEDVAAVDLACWRGVFSGTMTWPTAGALMHQGAAAENVYLIEEGFIKSVAVQEDGEETVVDLKCAPAILGATAAITKGRHQTTAIAAGPCQVRCCSVDAFRAAVAQDPARLMGLQLMQSVEIDDLSNRVATLGSNSSRRRLCRLLKELSARELRHLRLTGRPLRISLRLVEIAALIGITPEHLSRLLRQLTLDGTIKRQNGWIRMAEVS